MKYKVFNEKADIKTLKKLLDTEPSNSKIQFNFLMDETTKAKLVCLSAYTSVSQQKILREIIEPGINEKIKKIIEVESYLSSKDSLKE